MPELSFAAVGVSPASVSFDKMTRGGYAERYISVSNPSDQDIAVSAGGEGSIKDWLKVESGIVVKGKGSSTLKVTIEPPSDIPNGVYEGGIFISGSPVTPAELGGGAGATVISAVMVKTSIEISDIQILDLDIQSIGVGAAEECRQINIAVKVLNNGNIRTDAKFHVEILDITGEKKLKEKDFETEAMLPTKEYTYNIKVPYEMEQFECIPVGDYKAKVTTYLKDEAKDTRTIAFSIAKRGTYTMSGELVDATAPANASVNEIIKINGKFKNTGQFPAAAKLAAEVYHGSNLIKTIEGEKREVNTGSTDDLILYYTPDKAGKYKFHVFAKYEDKVTEAKDVIVDVISKGVSLDMNIIIVIVVILIIIGIVFIFLGKKAKKK